jgi:hypothetical protein
MNASKSMKLKLVILLRIHHPDASAGQPVIGIDGWSPEPVETVEVIDAAPSAALAGVLDVEPPGEELPPLWHWLHFLERPAQHELGPDGHPLAGHFLPPIPDRRRMFAGGRFRVREPLRIGDTVTRRAGPASPRPGRSSATCTSGNRYPGGSTPPPRCERPEASKRSSAPTLGWSTTTCGPSCSGRSQRRIRGLPDQFLRTVLPAGAGPGGHTHLAVQRPAQRRDRPTARRLCPLATRRPADRPDGLRQVRLPHPEGRDAAIKDSSRALLLEAKDNLQRMLAAIPLTDDERAAVDDGQAALDKLLGRLADVPTPPGPTPRQLGTPAAATLLPIVAVRQGGQASNGSDVGGG